MYMLHPLCSTCMYSKRWRICSGYSLDSPANRAKIVDGRLGKFASERSLLEQPYIKDPKKTVGQHIKEIISQLGESSEWAQNQIQDAQFYRNNLNGELSQLGLLSPLLKTQQLRKASLHTGAFMVEGRQFPIFWVPGQGGKIVED